MSGYGPGRIEPFYRKTAVLLFCLAVICFPVACTHGADSGKLVKDHARISDHFDGKLFFNPGAREPAPQPPGEAPRRGRSRWIWRLLLGNDWPEWPQPAKNQPGAPPAVRVPKGSLFVTPVGHATHLIQLDGLNILTDPIWSDRASPVSWAGPKRFRDPGIRFEDLPPINAVLVSHNHYDHLDLPTLKRLARKGVQRSITALGNRDLIQDAGISIVDELDWWQSVRLSEEITITLVPAQHFSSRTLWDRNETLWGGFVISGPSGNVYFAGDTGYGPHFREIARRFSPLRAAILPISPFSPGQAREQPQRYSSRNHMGPVEAVQTHLDLKAELSIAAHFQVFQLGADGFDDALNELRSVLAQLKVKPDTFITPLPGQPINLTVRFDNKTGLAKLQKTGANQ